MDLLMPWMTAIFIPLGLLFGSLANVIIYRLPLMLGVTEGNDAASSSVNLWWPPSHCPVCQSDIKPWDNIPVLSWLLLKGKCRQCGVAIPIIYPISELAMGLVWGALAWLCLPQLSLQLTLAYALLFMLLYTAAVIDFKHLILPDTLVFTALWGGLLMAAAGYSPIRVKDAIYGVAVAWLLLCGVMKLWEAFSKHGGLGYGDVKLYAACGAWLGWQKLPELLCFSALAGLLFYACVRIFAREDDESNNRLYLPFGPAIALAAFLLLL
ncbi:prepilin peptidase [Citrobacter braakii]|uniref:prepilin peptidase n=1 Tax=Citrobacter braakii TaxID=57706 RepID=UPI002270F841|nr:A24 family peptidase [Citrobacter braakii]WAD29064.1 prepilin peptidase [Citrobacter braakii]